MEISPKLTLISIHPEAGNVKTFRFDPGGRQWLAGQYQGYTLPQAGSGEAGQRWFTISSAPSSGTIDISTRISDSAFKQALNALQPGDTIDADQPEGDFTWQDEGDQSVVLVAAGIGVTPFHSILLERHAVGKPLSATLLYFNRDDEINFKPQLDELMEQHPEFTVRYIIGQPVTAETIIQFAPQSTHDPLYISGPEPMVIAVSEQLMKRGITANRDEFPGYNDKNY